VVDVSDPDNLVIDGYYAPSGCFALGVNVQGNDIFLSDGAGGFQIYNTTLITGAEQHGKPVTTYSSVYPNPFTDHVTITIDRTGDSDGVLSIYDASGRVIKTLLPGNVSENSVSYDWVAGNDMDPGFYFFKSATGQVSGKMVKMK
jgi:hypothetical protein